MSVAYWILQGLLAAAMALAGALKLAAGKDGLIDNPRMGWVEDASNRQVRALGSIEVAGAIGLILPWGLDIAPALTPIAAIGVAALMAGAVTVHIRRGEARDLAPAIGLGVIAVVIAIGRFAGL
ncbi:MAG: DoxX family protein [bacterium]|nr:DoxX family protein [bacterium]MCY3889635.1 DoxX family protein [bacterium]MCY3963384.1 DoxX family protein [bacterium]MCY4134851.1 DoxX family protein [bacterium]